MIRRLPSVHGAPGPRGAKPRDLEQIRARIADHLSDHDGYLSYSGGKDSLVVLDLALHVDPTVPVVFFDSGLEFPETRQNLTDVETHYGIRIERIPADPPLLELLLNTASWDHHDPRMRSRHNLDTLLIARPSAEAHRRHGPGNLWGVRAGEAAGRRRAYGKALTSELEADCAGCCEGPDEQRRRHGGIIRRVNGTVSYGPIWNWTTSTIWAHIARNRLPVNKVYVRLQRLGAPAVSQRVTHVLDGLALDTGRITWLARGWPQLYNELATVLPRIREYA